MKRKTDKGMVRGKNARLGWLEVRQGQEKTGKERMEEEQTKEKNKD